MKKYELEKIIKEEQLVGYNLNRELLHPNEVVLIKKDKIWKVGITDERATIFSPSVILFQNEEDAYDGFLEKLRILNKIMKLKQKRKSKKERRESTN